MLLRPWVRRVQRTHQNLLKQLLPSGIVVLLMDRVDDYTTLTFWAAIAFFRLRVVHAIGMISGFDKIPLRPILFSADWLRCFIMAYSVWAA